MKTAFRGTDQLDRVLAVGPKRPEYRLCRHDFSLREILEGARPPSEVSSPRPGSTSLPIVVIPAIMFLFLQALLILMLRDTAVRS